MDQDETGINRKEKGKAKYRMDYERGRVKR